MKNGAGLPIRGWILLAALFCAASMWIYADRVLIPYQVADAAANGRPRGNLSDLYPRWLGARELLLHGRDPYSLEVTRDIQTGYYGRPLDRTRPGDPKDQQGFAYPVYIVFFLAGTISSPFSIVHEFFFWALLGLTLIGSAVWLRALRWPSSKAAQITVLVLTLGSLPVMQGVKLEQMSLLVAGLLAVAVALLMKDHAVAAGMVLAFATIKPQLVLLLLLWLGIWTLADFRRRYVCLLSFGVTMAILVGASEWFLPHWVSRFLQAARDYQNYTGATGVMEKLAGPLLGRPLELVTFILLLRICWKERLQAARSSDFMFTVSFVLAGTVLLVPTYAVYNQVLLVPALLWLFKERCAIWREGGASRLVLGMTAGLALWPWLACSVLAVLSFLLSPRTVERAWALPFWTTLLLPVGVAALMLLHSGQRGFAESFEAPTS